MRATHASPLQDPCLVALPERLAQDAFEDLARSRARDFLHERDRTRDLVAGEVGAGEVDHRWLVEAGAGLSDDDRVHRLAPLLARNAEHGDVENLRVAFE